MAKKTLNPLAPVISSLVTMRNWAFDSEIIKTVRLKIPVVSVGNITMGGTGKTPFIHWLIGEIIDLDYRPGVISRNYRASSKSSGWVNTEPGSFSQFGDEAVLLKLKNPKIPILSGPQKWANALKMESEAKDVNVVLIDDGFQHRRLQRDFDIVLLDVSVAPKDYQWPPQGRARETLASLGRADALVFTRWEQRNEETVSFLQSASEFCPLQLKAQQVSSNLQWIAGRPVQKVDELKKGKGLAFCGLGNPSSFIKTLESQGLQIGEFIRFPDHAMYGAAEIKRLVELGEKFDYLVTSEKDMVKLQEWPFQGPSLCVIPMQLNVTGPLEAFREKLARSLWTNT